jgi:SpoIID/LytB domain protein
LWSLRKKARFLGTLTGLAVIGGPLLPAVPARASSPVPGTVDISGFGYGHGRGMGQWGAFGYASEFGWGYRQILAHYYGGTSLGTIAAPEPDVVVHLVELDGHNTIASALTGGELVATWPGGAPQAAAAFEVARSGGSQAIYSSAGCAGPWREIATTAQPVTIASAQVGPVEAAGVAASELQACIPGVGARTYQGVLVAQPGGQTQNVVGLEDYVDGVVPAESPAGWAAEGGGAALEAQAVAARSYALASITATGDLCDDAACQMYLGLPDQYGLTADAAVAATAGQVLDCDAGSACGPAGTVAPAEYSASTGGYTAGGAFPAVADLGDSVAANPVHTWTIRVPVSRLESVFPSIGTWQSIDVTHRNGLGQIGGRVEQLFVTGTSGSVSLTGAQFAADLSLPSNWFQVGPASVLPPTTTSPGATTSTTAPSSTTTTPSTTTPTSTTTTTPGPANGAAPPVATLAPGEGYWVVSAQGDVAAFGAATSYGTAVGSTIEGKVVAMAATPDDKGYWLAGGNGGVLAFGDAHWYGSASALHVHQPFVAMAGTGDGRGYWLVSRNGGVFTYGDAVFYGSLGNLHVGATIVGLATTPDDRGYWLVSSAGAIFAFGDARFYGSTGADILAQPVTGIVASPDGRGYFLVARDGGVFAFGDATFMGSLPGEGIRAKVVAVAPTREGSGYYVLAANGRVFAFGTASAPRVLLPARSTAPGHAVAIVCYRSAA